MVKFLKKKKKSFNLMKLFFYLQDSQNLIFYALSYEFIHHNDPVIFVYKFPTSRLLPFKVFFSNRVSPHLSHGGVMVAYSHLTRAIVNMCYSKRFLFLAAYLKPSRKVSGRTCFQISTPIDGREGFPTTHSSDWDSSWVSYTSILTLSTRKEHLMKQ